MTPPTIAPVLLAFVPVVAAFEGIEATGTEPLDDPAGDDVVDGPVGLVFFASEGFEVVIVEVSFVPLVADVEVVVAAWLVELELEPSENVCAFSPGEEENVMPKGVSTPDPPGVGRSSAWQATGNADWLGSSTERM